ncbi:MAG: ABC transporter ATP-binding protein/permease [Alphaproteobacteria bacterium]|nr:ABC transporter ATP-binding protein/permease [Alphaproteobacteria bacterium]
MNLIKRIKSFIKNDNPDAKIKWSLYIRVWKEFGKPYWKWLALGVLCTTLAASAEAYTITLIKKIVDGAVGEKLANSTNMKMELRGLAWVGLQIIAAFGAKGLFTYAKTLTMTKAGLLGVSSLRRRLYRNMMKQSVRFFHETHTGVLMNYFTGMASAVLSLVTDNVIKTVNNIATVGMMIGLMLYYAPQLTVVLVFLVPAVIVPLIVITRKKNILTRRGFGVEADSITHITQSLEGIKTIQAFCNEEEETTKMNQMEDQRIKVHFKRTRLSAMRSPIMETMISVGLCLSLLIGGYFILNKTITPGAFTAFLLALTAAYKPAKSLTGVNDSIQAGLIAAESLFDFLDKKSDIQDACDAKVLSGDEMRVELDNVTFAYNEKDGPVLRNISLNVEPGKVCAFVGPSGGGKSTIFNLLERFYDTQKGKVKINGVDIRQYTLESLRRNISNVSQDVFLFNGTIADNIRYGNPDATMEQIQEAAKAANAHGFIMEFPDGYNNFVGERGVLLSGGQKQRIAIARAILKDAPILLLDEATSALDSESEKLIQAALKKLMKGRTTFVIAHRLATILDADVICVVKNGCITEQGTDAELYAKGGDYTKLKDIQFKKKK